MSNPLDELNEKLASLRKYSGQKTKSKKQVRYLLSKGSPLTEEQKKKLKGELHSGEVEVED